MTPGTQVSNYIIKELLGEGGMARVYLVEHVHLESKHALKVLLPGWLQDEELRLRFIGEGRIQAKLQHPNIVPVTDVVSVPGVAGLVMNFVEGITLEEFIRQNPKPSVELIRGVFLQVLEAMGFAHENGIVHRDIKPSNILISKNRDGSLLAQVLDFGIAKVFEEQGRSATRTGMRMGTPQYMSPEQVRGAKDVDHRSDIFSLGALLYEMLSGREAFDGESEFDIQTAITQGNHRPLEILSAEMRNAFGSAIAGALKVDKAERFQSCVEFAAALGEGSSQAVEVVKALWEAPKPVPKPPAQLSQDMVYIPGGSFVMGASPGFFSNIFGKYADESPATHVTLSPYYIDRNFVTVADYRAAVEAGACEVPVGTVEHDSSFNWGHPERDDHPINGASWRQAVAYCRWRGGRLPTEAEWEYAARGGDGRLYPWGNEPPENRACWDGLGSRLGYQQRMNTCPVGQYPSGASFFGLLDMAGNVWEWVGDWYFTSLPGGHVKDPVGPSVGGDSRVLRGGSWGNAEPNSLRAGFRSKIQPRIGYSTVGFRCVRLTPP